MVAPAALPLLKLGGLLVKQITKPLTSRLRIEATKRKRIGYVCSYLGQKYHYLSSRLAVFANGYNFIGVKPLPEEDAIKSGAEMISETIVLCIAAGIVIVEYDRSERKNAIKAEKAAQKEALASRLLEERFSRIEAALKELQEERKHSATTHNNSSGLWNWGQLFSQPVTAKPKTEHTQEKSVD